MRFPVSGGLNNVLNGDPSARRVYFLKNFFPISPVRKPSLERGCYGLFLFSFCRYDSATSVAECDKRINHGEFSGDVDALVEGEQPCMFSEPFNKCNGPGRFGISWPARGIVAAAFVFVSE